ncbi:MAG: hypothetical protein Q4E98_07705 [Acidaminococcaceae bacterium]|uniref:hypothetical protein n=1 Tax=uncultured Phascolarctobacterium sp. TaxID=512296 RepID=UPI0025D76E47|nr:hypothetical protein [uncultured Phascolarctobacterium sp.]MDO5380743.1 hypothetical protein [Acidaminococcaceae bacterium]
MSSNPKTDVRSFINQVGNTCGAHSIYNYLVLIGEIASNQDPDTQRTIIQSIYKRIISEQTREAALPNLMLAVLKESVPSITLYGSKEFQSKLEEICSQLRIAEKINYADNLLSNVLKFGAYGIALWSTKEEFPPLTQLATMHYTVVYKNAGGDIYALDSNCPAEGWQLVGHQFTLHFMGLLFA